MRILVIDKKVVVLLCLALVAVIISIPFCINNLLPVTLHHRDLPIYSVEKADKEISITFDCAWGNEDINQIIEALKLYDCKATFFVVGDFIDKYPNDVKKLYGNGNEIANHSDNHAHYNFLTRDSMIRDMDNCDNKIKKITGKYNNVFRAPYGEYNSLLVRTCKDTKRYCIQWDVDSLDYRGLTPDQMEKRIFSKIKPGSILLFHTGTRNTASALPQILNRLKNEGYTFKTISELIYKDNYIIDSTGRQIKAVN